MKGGLVLSFPSREKEDLGVRYNTRDNADAVPGACGAADTNQGAMSFLGNGSVFFSRLSIGCGRNGGSVGLLFRVIYCDDYCHSQFFFGKQHIP